MVAKISKEGYPMVTLYVPIYIKKITNSRVMKLIHNGDWNQYIITAMVVCLLLNQSGVQALLKTGLYRLSSSLKDIICCPYLVTHHIKQNKTKIMANTVIPLV